jgi:hypothetical protein
MTALQQLAGNSTGDRTITNENFKTVAPAAVFAKRYTTTSGLTWGYYGGDILVDGVLTTIANGTVALTASNTNYVEVDRAGTVTANTTGFTVGRRALHEVVTNTTVITADTDRRNANDRATGRLSLSVAGGANVTLTAAEARNDILEFTGALTANISVILPVAEKQYTVFNNTTGAFTLAVDVAGTPGGTTVGQGLRAIVYADGTNIVRATADV